MGINFRTLGRSKLKISEIGFGAGGFWGMKRFPFKTAEQLILTAIEINQPEH